jgi:hypothetical protein
MYPGVIFFRFTGEEIKSHTSSRVAGIFCVIWS